MVVINLFLIRYCRMYSDDEDPYAWDGILRSTTVKIWAIRVRMMKAFILDYHVYWF